MAPKKEAGPKGSLISYFSSKVKKYGGINLAQGRPGFYPPEDLIEILKKNINDPDLHQYAPGNGSPDLLEIISKKYRSFFDFSKNNFLVTSGATEAIFLSFFYLAGLLKRPFSALSFDPVYESYPKLSSFFGIPFHYFTLQNSGKVDFYRLEETIRNENIKIILISSPGNPMGKIWTEEEMRTVFHLSKKYDFYILFDAVYSDIYFNYKPFNPLSFKNIDNIFYVNSFSKMLSITGWRIGYLTTSEKHMANIRNIHDYTGLSSPYIFQRSIAEFMDRFNMGESYTDKIRKKCKKNYRYMKVSLEKHGFIIPPADGGYFLWGKIPERYGDSFTFAERLFEDSGVAVVPGENFSPYAKDFIRINIATDFGIIEEGATKIVAFINKDQ